VSPATRSDSESIGTAVLGGGPAGLTAGYVLALRGRRGRVLEASDIVGGIAQTREVRGYRFDLGGHRFFTKLRPVEKLWEAIMGEDFLTRPRLSRIYYDHKFMAYPLVAKDVLPRLGVYESAMCALSYLWSQAKKPFRRREPETFEEWVTEKFGHRLYGSFFGPYSEKVWGIPGSEIRAQWAAQRIKDFSLLMAVLSILRLKRGTATTLIEQFRYPRKGPGQMWERFAAYLDHHDVPVELEHRVKAIRHHDFRATSVLVERGGEEVELEVDGVLSSLPLSEMVLALDPPAPEEVRHAARRLRYRDYVLVALMTTQEEPFPDNWIYLHDPGTRAGRVQNFGAWSPDMVKPGTTCLGVEYFCFEGDDLWEMPEQRAIELATEELAQIGLIDPELVFDGVKVNVPKAYPMYDATYVENVEVLRHYVESFGNLKTFGRNGLHRYNNQDHSMWSAILATLNLADGTDYDVWTINTEDAYHEEGEVVDELLSIELVPPAVLEEAAEVRELEHAHERPPGPPEHSHDEEPRIARAGVRSTPAR
jgi:protoporphyrinogen oxidase